MGRPGPGGPGEPGGARPAPRRRQRRRQGGLPRPSPNPGPHSTPEAPPHRLPPPITAQGFRGIGPQATLDLTPGPGLTLVVGRNGSGKSSFAEGLELLFTGDTYRWSQRSKVWRDGWRNLHHPKAALAAEFALEGERGAAPWRANGRTGPTSPTPPPGPRSTASPAPAPRPSAGRPPSRPTAPSSRAVEQRTSDVP